MQEVINYLGKIATSLKNQAQQDLADRIASVIQDIEKEAGIDKEAQEMIAAEEQFIRTALDECAAADAAILEAQRAIEAARKQKKKWVQNIGLKKGRLTEYKKPGESMMDAAKRALKSDDPSVRGMGSFYMATRKFKHKKGKN
jgi:phosphoribosylformylglycinamidine (FGAM) synthase-like enzyme